MNDLYRRVWLRRWLSGVAVMCCLLPAPKVPDAHDGVMHGDHNPHHGGYVLMYGEDLHYEIVLAPNGKIQLYLSGPLREDLPASTASDVAVEIETTGGQQESVNMGINDTGDCWEGQGSAMKDAGATLHLAFVFRGQPAVISLPTSPLIDAVKQSAGQKAGQKSDQGGAKPTHVTEVPSGRSEPWVLI